MSDTPLGLNKSTPSPDMSSIFKRVDLMAGDITDPSPRYTSPVSTTNPFEPRGVTGLGISNGRQSIKRVPVGRIPFAPLSLSRPLPPSTGTRNPRNTTQYADSPGTSASGSSNPLLSPAWPVGDTIESRGSSQDQSLDEQDITKGKNTYVDHADIGNEILCSRSESSSVKNDHNETMRLFPPAPGCPAKHDIYSRRRSRLSVSILSLSVYSTIFSGLYMALAIASPRYGRVIQSRGTLTPETASILFALVAKTIELSFVTVFVAFLGQVLSRRSLVKSSRGVTIAEFTMRTWVIQPGFMITHWQTLTHVGVSLLGLITLVAAFVAMFYTTASDALVSPHLKFGKWENKNFSGLVRSSYANPKYINQNCHTPISVEVDPLNAGLTCLSVEHAGQAYHNSITFLETWTQINVGGAGASSDITLRPQAPAMLYDNTTVVGSWVAGNSSNMTAAYEKYARIVNNVTLSMPHAGIFAAARNPKNGVLQPEELAGVGEYSLEASVASPTLNVLCVNLNATELAPLIYTEFPNAKTTHKSGIPGQLQAEDPSYKDEIQLMPGSAYLNATVVDDIFGWGSAHGRNPPVFPMYPIDYNSVTNITVDGAGGDAIYMLIKAPSTSTPDYTICQMRSYLSSSCSTSYNVSGMSGGRMEARCSDPHNPMAYSRSVDNNAQAWNKDWRNVGSQWMLSLSLNTGVSNANSSTSRLLAQLIPTTPPWGDVELPVLLPTMAEMLAVMAGSSLLLSSTDSTFYHYWAYQANIMDPGVFEGFNATITSQQYTSGVTQPWQAVFYPVLALVFLTNVTCLLYFCLRTGLVTDFTELQNLFALAVNSPPATRLDGSCGAGPQGEQLNVDFHVLADEASGHFYVREGMDGDAQQAYSMRQRRWRRRRNSTQEFPLLKSMTNYGKLSVGI